MKRRVLPPAWLVALVVLVYSALFFLAFNNLENSLKRDSPGYLALAGNLSEHHVFSRVSSPPWTPEFLRLPAYPLFLAITHTRPSSFQWAIFLQCLMGPALLFLLWPSAFRLGGRKGATLGALFLCLEPVCLLHQNLLLTESLMTLTLTSAIALAIRYEAQPTLGRAAWAALFFSLAAFIKPIGLFPAGLFIFCSIRDWKSGCMIALITCSLPLGWTLRNWHASGHPVYTIQGGHDLLIYPAANALVMDTGRSREEVIGMMERALAPKLAGLDQDLIAQNKVFQTMAIQIMKEHPMATIKVCFRGAVAILGGTGLEMMLDLFQIRTPQDYPINTDDTSFGAGTRKLLRNHPWFIVVQLACIIFLLAGYGLYGLGLQHLIQRGAWRLALFNGGTVLIMLAVSAHQGYYRFRIPLIPFLAFGIAASMTPRPKENL